MLRNLSFSPRRRRRIFTAVGPDVRFRPATLVLILALLALAGPVPAATFTIIGTPGSDMVSIDECAGVNGQIRATAGVTICITQPPFISVCLISTGCNAPFSIGLNLGTSHVYNVSTGDGGDSILIHDGAGSDRYRLLDSASVADFDIICVFDSACGAASDDMYLITDQGPGTAFVNIFDGVGNDSYVVSLGPGLDILQVADHPVSFDAYVLDGGPSSDDILCVPPITGVVVRINFEVDQCLPVVCPGCH